MEWRDQAVILAVRRHGETSAIVEALTAEHGRSLGLVRGGRSRRLRPVLQPGNQVDVTWRARLEEHLGTFAIEATSLRAGPIMEDPFRLAGLSTLTVLSQLLAEREPHRRLFDAALVVLEALDREEAWPPLLVRWEMGLLDELGFGLDLANCVATGARDDLVFVSPRSGRAVSSAAGEPYRDQLLPLPAFLIGGPAPTDADIIAGFRLTGHFLGRHLFEPRGLASPEPRDRMIRTLAERPH
ncbi:MAG: DNA repair protein RecO [Rhizobiales bacterium]|nr:DNA repair protein RecO [Hyphomicrobiales bacterium]MBI3674475.1 DNA repair protein RecO [Hyphomicrobiales bacterium]